MYSMNRLRLAMTRIRVSTQEPPCKPRHELDRSCYIEPEREPVGTLRRKKHPHRQRTALFELKFKTSIGAFHRYESQERRQLRLLLR